MQDAQRLRKAQADALGGLGEGDSLVWQGGSCKVASALLSTACPPLAGGW